MAQSSEAVEYTDCICAERRVSLNESPGYLIKLSAGKAPVMLELNCQCLEVHSGSE